MISEKEQRKQPERRARCIPFVNGRRFSSLPLPRPPLRAPPRLPPPPPPAAPPPPLDPGQGWVWGSGRGLRLPQARLLGHCLALGLKLPFLGFRAEAAGPAVTSKTFIDSDSGRGALSFVFCILFVFSLLIHVGPNMQGPEGGSAPGLWAGEDSPGRKGECPPCPQAILLDLHTLAGISLGKGFAGPPSPGMTQDVQGILRWETQGIPAGGCCSSRHFQPAGTPVLKQTGKEKNEVGGGGACSFVAGAVPGPGMVQRPLEERHRAKALKESWEPDQNDKTR